MKENTFFFDTFDETCKLHQKNRRLTLEKFKITRRIPKQLTVMNKFWRVHNYYQTSKKQKLRFNTKKLKYRTPQPSTLPTKITGCSKKKK